ncbi:MAG: TetR family transcriptional regulator [Novosphingobium sp.]
MDKRSLHKREIIADSVITVLSESGISGLTHRRVARAAGISLSATTYHYATKADMLAEASGNLLEGYLTAFRRSALEHREGRGRDSSPQAFMTRLLVNAAGRHRRESLAWCEIILDAAKSPEGHQLARHWFEALHEAWSALFRAFGADCDDADVQIVIDTVIGLMFIVLPLNLSPARVAEIRSDAWSQALEASSTMTSQPADADRPLGKKAQATRARILDGAIKVLKESGVANLSYRAVAEESGVALTAPAYYFGSIETLIRAAEAELFQESKARYRQMLSVANLDQPSAGTLADLTAAILVREATEFRLASIAHYSVWLAATRIEALRPAVASAVVDQIHAWQRRIAHLGAVVPGDGTYLQALFLGQHIRSLACGAPLTDMSKIRGYFLKGLSQRLDGKK